MTRARDAPIGESPIDDARIEEDVRPRRRVGLVITIVLGLGMVALIAILASRLHASTGRARARWSASRRPTSSADGTSSDGAGDFDLVRRRGSFVLVNFSPLVRAVQEGAPRAGVVRHRPPAQTGDADVVSVVFGDDNNDVKKFFQDNGGEWTVVSDPDGTTALSYGVTGIPESFLIDPNGFVVSKITGGVTSDGLDAIITAAERAESGTGG